MKGDHWPMLFFFLITKGDGWLLLVGYHHHQYKTNTSRPCLLAELSVTSACCAAQPLQPIQTHTACSAQAADEAGGGGRANYMSTCNLHVPHDHSDATHRGRASRADATSGACALQLHVKHRDRGNMQPATHIGRICSPHQRPAQTPTACCC
jgi:hypothetical protein